MAPPTLSTTGDLSDADAAGAAIGQDGIDQTMLDQAAVDQGQRLPPQSPITISSLHEAAAPPIVFAAVDALEATSPPEPLEPLRLPASAAGEGEATFAPDISAPEPATQPPLDPQASEMKDLGGEDWSDMNEKMPTREQIEQRAYELYGRGTARMGMTYLIGRPLKEN